MEEKVIFDEKNNLYIFKCPHCDMFIEVEKNSVNCTIFRHAYFFRENNGNIVLTEQLNPHAPKEVCEQLRKEGKIYGCGKPFRMEKVGDFYKIKICDYI